MIRIATPTGYILVTHQEHARLAGRFAALWGNTRFPSPAPAGSPLLAEILLAVAGHDDAWAARDAAPFLTRDGRPSAFTRELVGTYSAFEEIDLADYLAVRGAGTESLAAAHPYAAILVSMHTVNLLTEQADLSTIKPEERALHAAFIAQQERRQAQLVADMPASFAPYTDPSTLRRAFEFLQACDNLSLLTCVGYEQPRALRHQHADVTGTRHSIECLPVSERIYRLDPWPLGVPACEFSVPARHVSAEACVDLASYRAAYAAAPIFQVPIHLRAAA
jgi:Protein of unknown function (DUF3891)